MESCWGSLKTELVHHRRFASREQAKREITEYIEIFYNRIRKQGDSAICRPPLSVSNTMQCRWPLEPVGLYDLQPTSNRPR